MPRALQTVVGGHPLVAKTLVRRGIASPQAAKAFLDPAYYLPTSPTELPGIVRAAERLERAVNQGERVVVWGDFDVDGQTSTTILVSTLRELGASVSYHIPNRGQEGHGVNLPALERIIAAGADVVLTCDTGVTAHDPIACAQVAGVDVIVTDHHDLPPVLPEAYSVTDSKMLPETHPLRELPGVGVAYKLAELLYARAGRPHGADQYLDLVALGIVADVAVQTGDVRYLLQRGLEALRHTERIGLQVLIEIAELNPQWLTEEHIGFELAPRLNALGRLADANPAVEFLTTGVVERARILAHELDGLNARRKMMCNQVMGSAEAQIERDPSLLEQGALVLSHPAWPGGVIGIVAGRLAGKYHRPTVLIAAPPGELARGSARSIPGCDISAAIAEQAEMLEGFGGHPMAAGLGIDAERIPTFRRALSQTVQRACGGALAEEPRLQIDGYVDLVDLSLDFVEQIERLAPFGAGNPALKLATKGLSLKGHATVGRLGEHLKLTVEDEDGVTQSVLWWRAEESDLPRGPFDLAYAVRASDYRGQRDVQLEWIDARPVETVETVRRPELPAVEVVDWREVPDPHDRLARLRAERDVVVWREGDPDVVGRDRYALGDPAASAETLAIWSAPPGPYELRDVLHQVSPRMVILLGVDPELDQPQRFLVRLAGLVKRALRSEGGRIDLSALAAATAQREETVRAGIAWLAARGDVVVLADPQAPQELGKEPRLAAGEGETAAGRDRHVDRSDADLARAVTQLRSLLEETAAYRAYFARADAEVLIDNARSG
ncbi:MAG: single-stranded-DNA-specific exonuclease RecJ [Anaerolineae bacterium]